MPDFRKPIDFKGIAAEHGVNRGRIFHSPYWGWVLEGHTDVDLISIEPPHKIGDETENGIVEQVQIVDNSWKFTCKRESDISKK